MLLTIMKVFAKFYLTMSAWTTLGMVLLLKLVRKMKANGYFEDDEIMLRCTDILSREYGGINIIKVVTLWPRILISLTKGVILGLQFVKNR